MYIEGMPPLLFPFHIEFEYTMEIMWYKSREREREEWKWIEIDKMKDLIELESLGKKSNWWKKMGSNGNHCRRHRHLHRRRRRRKLFLLSL